MSAPRLTSWPSVFFDDRPQPRPRPRMRGTVAGERCIGLAVIHTLGDRRHGPPRNGWGGPYSRHDVSALLRSDVLRRVVGSAAGLYLLFAVIGRFVEAMGAARCGCSADCWCHRPVLSVFRWILPFGLSPAGTAEA